MDTPRVYFLGIRNVGSAAHRMFPGWMSAIGRPALLVGVDLPNKSPCGEYRDFLKSMRDDEYCLGAQVTSHKVSVYDCVGAELDGLDPDVRALGEVGAISVTDNTMIGFSPDMLALQDELSVMLGEKRSPYGAREAVILGGGGAGRAIALTSAKLGSGTISRITITERNPDVRADLETRFKDLLRNVNGPDVEIKDGTANDQVVTGAAPGSLIVNATGIGKDSAGSPISAAALLPRGSIAWDLNYRGDLGFLRCTRPQAAERGARLVDGWDYFLRNWFSCLTRLTGVAPTQRLFERFRQATETARMDARKII